MSSYEKLVNQKFGLLTVKEFVCTGKRKNNSKIYAFVCDCDCGTKDLIKDCGQVKHGRVTSCGCRRDQYAKFTGKNSPRYTGYEDISGKFWATLKQSARLRNHQLKLTIQEAWELFLKQEKKCALTSLPLTFAKSNRTTSQSDYTASLDRIDSKKDYTADNIQWVHKDVNLMKQQYNHDYFIYMCHLVSEQNQKPKDFNKLERGGRFGKLANI